MKRILTICKYGALGLYIIVVVFPMAWMAMSSFKTTREIQSSPWSLPHELSDRESKLASVAKDLKSGVDKLPDAFPDSPEAANSAADVFAKLGQVAGGQSTNGPIEMARLLAPELRDIKKYISRSTNMADELREYAKAEPGSAESASLKERYQDDYTKLEPELATLASQIASKARQGVFSNYVEAWTTTQIGRAFMNSFIVSLATMIVLIPISAMASYVLAKYKFKGSNALFLLFLGGMMFPQFLVIVPLFLQMSSLGLDDNLFGLTLVYIAFSLPFTVFVLTGFFHQLPDELGEAAMLDGCGHQATFWKIMVPLAKPGLVVVTIFDVIGLWNEYNLALVLMRSRDGFTLPRALDSLQITAQYLGDTGALMAAMVIVILPVLIVYWLLKDKIHEAMLAGAVKG